VFLDPPYGQGLIPRAIACLHGAGCIGPNALIVAEAGRDETWVPEERLLAERQRGAARMLVFRASALLESDT
jgi:16S rRNA (guanine966-N2)-methyltransferase